MERPPLLIQPLVFKPQPKNLPNVLSLIPTGILPTLFNPSSYHLSTLYRD